MVKLQLSLQFLDLKQALPNQLEHCQLAVLAKDFQDNEEALQSFDKAIKQRNDLYPAWLYKGIALSELKRYDEALVAFNKAKSLNPKDPTIWASTARRKSKVKSQKSKVKSIMEWAFYRF